MTLTESTAGCQWRFDRLGERPMRNAPPRRRGGGDQKFGPRLTCQSGDAEYRPFVRQATSTLNSANQT